MLQPIKKMPTLGYFNKVVCEILGLWTTDKQDTVFNVPATEKERRKALHEAFSAIIRKDGSFGNIVDLISVTTKISPQNKLENKKNKTIQDYINHLSKEDFCSLDEFNETKKYLDIIIGERFTEKYISSFASSFYISSVMHYREFIREHASKAEYSSESYLYFIKYIFFKLIGNPDDTELFKPTEQNNKWPLRTFIDKATELCGISLHKLHQFHEMRSIPLNSVFSNKEIWDQDLTAQLVNSRSKQIVDRLKKSRKINWDNFLFVIKPLVCLLPESVGEERFIIEAYLAFLSHNTNNYILKLNSSDEDNTPSELSFSFLEEIKKINHLPVSDKIDLLLHSAEEENVEYFMNSYDEFINKLRLLKFSLIKDSSVPSTIYYTYSHEYLEFPIRKWSESLSDAPVWINKWILAKAAVSAGDTTSALQYYKNALEEAKYSAGPLFAPLYVEICAFCKRQYQELKNKNEEHLFDRFYEPLGSSAAKYASLLGYTSGSIRDPKTLMPRFIAPRKDFSLIKKIDAIS